jgi:hypothetical protein
VTSGRSGKPQPGIIEDAAIKASPVNRTRFITGPGQVRARFVALCGLAAKSYEAVRIEITTRCSLVPSSPLLSPLQAISIGR